MVPSISFASDIVDGSGAFSMADGRFWAGGVVWAHAAEDPATVRATSILKIRCIFRFMGSTSLL
jgi:hypothetical protein